MGPRRVGRHVGGGHEPDDERAGRERKDRLREALSFWATGVSILAVREDAGGTGGRVHALTVSAFIPVSLDPPVVLTSLGPNAAALPYLEEGTRYVISILAGDQRGLAARYADTFPVGPSPFPPVGEPRVEGSVAALVCDVDELLRRGDHTLVLGRVAEAVTDGEETALAYYRRAYHRMGASGTEEEGA